MRTWVLLMGLLPATGWAYTIKGGSKVPCHERITRDAFFADGLLLAAPGGPFEPPLDGVSWRDISDELIDREALFGDVPADYAAYGKEEAVTLFFTSLLVGVRGPDTEGHSITNVNSLRRIHADRDPEGQYAHALRAPDDDEAAGDEAAIAGTRAEITRLVQLAIDPDNQKIVTKRYYLDFYGLVDLEVWAPAYYLGRAAHAVEDSFAHTIRTSDLRKIRHVLNFVDAITGTLDVHRDGLAHSGEMDHCDAETQAIVAGAIAATSELFLAAAMEPETPGALEAFLDAWITYEPGLDPDTYCASKADPEPTACKSPTTPILSCATTGDSPGAAWWLLLLLPWGFARRRRGALAALAVAALGVADAEAQPDATEETTPAAPDAWPIQLELHVSGLNDAPNRSILASSFGFGLRGGWRRGALGLFGHFERNYWLATDQDIGVFAGTLDIAFGAEYLFAGERLRSSVAFGSSILMDDTPLDEAGQAGGFMDLRPVEFRWAVGDGVFLNFTPLGFTVVAPVFSASALFGDESAEDVDHPPLQLIQYRTTGAVEYVF